MSQTISDDLLNRKREIEQSLSMSMMESEFSPIHNIYFDLSILQDTNIGTLLLHTKTEEEYNSILAGIPYYLSRIEPAVCKYFPSTSLTDEDIVKFVKDPTNAEQLYKASPHTTVWFMLPHIFKRIYERNRMVDKPENFRCNLYLDLQNVAYTSKVCQVIKNKILKINPKITLMTLTKSIFEVSRSTRMIPDIYFIEDIGQWIGTDSAISKEFYEDLLYEKKHFLSKRVITATDVTVPLEDAFFRSRDFIRTFTAFDFIDVGIPGVQYIPPVVDNDPSDKIVS